MFLSYNLFYFNFSFTCSRLADDFTQCLDTLHFIGKIRVPPVANHKVMQPTHNSASSTSMNNCRKAD